MATMQDWVDQLVAKELPILAPGITSSPQNSWPGYPFATSQWPFSGFFDWFDNPHGPGYLPSFMNCTVKSATPPSCGWHGGEGGEYSVNNKYVFIGLNPNFAPSASSWPANDGNFMGFNMDTSDPVNGYSLARGGTLADLWKIMALISSYPNPSVSRLYDEFKASYMTDIAINTPGGKSGSVRNTLGGAKRAPVTNSCKTAFDALKVELEVFKSMVKPNPRTLTFIVFRPAYDYFISFKYKNRHLFPGASIIQVLHYSRGGAVRTVQALARICSINWPILGFPATISAPVHRTTW